MLVTLLADDAALVYINRFLATKILPTIDKLSEQQLCSIQLFQELGTYLIDFALKKDGKFLDAPENYISKAKTFAQN